MKTRAITGFFFVIVMLGSVLLGPYVFGIFFLVLGTLSLYEFYGLVRHAALKPNMIAGIINGVMVYAGFLLLVYADNHVLASPGGDKVAHGLLFLLPIMFAAVFIDELFRHSAMPITNIAYTYLGIIFIIVPFTFFHAMAYIGGSFNFHYPLAFLLLLWGNDTGAYLVGMKFGKTKLFERHSPKKTWEGFLGGILVSAIIAFIISRFFTDLPWNQWVSVAILISCFGTLGDLTESMFKRSINVKDSGGLLPGHGGLLDRFDGLLLAAPVVYTYLYFIRF